MGHFRVLATFLAVITASAALGLPASVTRNDTVDDATVTVTIWDAFILGDARSWCELRIQVGNGDVAFKANDTVELWLYEDDTVGDEVLWHHIFNVNAAQISGGVDETFDCTADFLDDVGSTSEIYAEAEVTKDNCGFLCVYDRPSTGLIDAAELDDDGNDDGAGDDNFGAARTLPNGALPGRINRDADWYVIDATGPMSLDVSVLHRPEGGRLDLGLYDSFGIDTGTAATDAADRARLQVANLALGTWYVRVLPRTASDFNFYDLDSSLQSLVTTCTPGNQSSRAAVAVAPRCAPATSRASGTPTKTAAPRGCATPGRR